MSKAVKRGFIDFSLSPGFIAIERFFENRGDESKLILPDEVVKNDRDVSLHVDIVVAVGEGSVFDVGDLVVPAIDALKYPVGVAVCVDEPRNRKSDRGYYIVREPDVLARYDEGSKTYDILKARCNVKEPKTFDVKKAIRALPQQGHNEMMKEQKEALVDYVSTKS